MSTGEQDGSPHHPGNIFLPLLELAGTSSARIAYDNHRTARNAAQRALLLDSGVPLIVDDVLSEIVATTPPDFSLDRRHNIALWARPSEDVKGLVEHIQEKLREAVGDDQGIWFPPPSALHMTVFEVTNGLTSDGLLPIVSALLSHSTHVTTPPSPPITLDAPQLNYDISGIALSFLPRDSALLELRARVWDTVARAGVQAKMRYALPSAHVTVGRLVARGRGLGMEHVEWVKLLDDINAELKGWKGEWQLDKLVLRAGMQWYGGGYSIAENGVRRV